MISCFFLFNGRVLLVLCLVVSSAFLVVFVFQQNHHFGHPKSRKRFNYGCFFFFGGGLVGRAFVLVPF